ncbi:hypothetical protein SLS61_000926 [Didymella pomorum]
MSDQLHSDSNSSLYPGNDLWSSNRRARLAAQNDGNVVIYAVLSSGEERAIWSTDTQGRSWDRLCMNGNGELCLFVNSQGGDTAWKSGKGDWNTGIDEPFLLSMQNDGNLCVYGSGDRYVWGTQTHISQPIRFSQVTFVNASNGADIYPMIKNARGDKVLWNPREENTYWLLNQGQSKVADLNKDDYGGKVIGNIIKDDIGADKPCPVSLGFNVVFGDDVWTRSFTDNEFVYDSSSNQKVTIRKYGGLRDGDASYEGVQNI